MYIYLVGTRRLPTMPQDMIEAFRSVHFSKDAEQGAIVGHNSITDLTDLFVTALCNHTLLREERTSDFFKLSPSAVYISLHYL